VIDIFDGVSASAVIGIVDENSGEVPIAYVELDEDVESIDESGIYENILPTTRYQSIFILSMSFLKMLQVKY